MHSLFRHSLGFVAVVLALAGCSADGGGTAAVDGALTSGRVDATGGASSNVSVRAYGVAPDGSMTPASDPATTSADGRYSLHVSLDSAATALVVRVEDGTNRMTSLGRVGVDSDVNAHSSITLTPIDSRSTLTANVVLSLEASENVSAEETSAISLFLSPEAAASISASADIDAATSDTVEAVSSARATFVEGLDESASGAGSVQLALRSIGVNEATLAAHLDAATGSADVQAAYATYLQAVVTGTGSAGYSSEAVAAAAISASSALDANVGARVSGSRAELHELSTFAVTAAVDMGIASSIDSSAIGDASDTLRASVQSMASTHASADASASAWASYETTIQSEVDAHTTLETTLVTTLTAEVATATTALAATWAQIGASASASERVHAFTTFRATVESSGHLSLLTTAGMSDGSAHALLDAMADVGASTIVR